jgi:predicted integral membrane protein DUF2269
MDLYQLLRFLHVIGFIFLGGGLLAVFVSEWRGYGATRSVVFAEAAFYTAIFYDFVVLPGAFLMLTTGPLLIWELGLSYFNTPWLMGMWGLFLFEFIEGNSVTRVQFRRTLKISRSLAEDEPLTDEMRGRARTFIGRLAHFLDVPLFSVIVYCGVVRPDSWLDVGSAIGIAIAAALVLMSVVPRLAERLGGVIPRPSL